MSDMKVTPEFSVKKLEQVIERGFSKTLSASAGGQELWDETIRELLATLKGFDRRVTSLAAAVNALEKRVDELDVELEGKG